MGNHLYKAISTILVLILLISAASVKAQQGLPPMGQPDSPGETVGLAEIVSIASVTSEAFSYQGLLEENGVPVDGIRDMDFMLHSDSDCTHYVSGYYGISDVPIENGLFSVELDFDQDYFNGQQLYLLVEVEGNEVGCVEILPVPYALSLSPGAIIVEDSTDDYAAAVTGVISTTSPGGYSAGLLGIHSGGLGWSFGVYGSNINGGYGVFGEGAHAGVFGKSYADEGHGVIAESWGNLSTAVEGWSRTDDIGFGVHGKTSAFNGAGVVASSRSYTSTAFLISHGAFSVEGGALGSYSPVFIHQATVTNTWGLYDENTNIDHPLTNGNPGAVLFVTMNTNPYIAGVAENPHPIAVEYHSELPFWYIYNLDDAPMPVGATFNVFVVTPWDP